MLCSGILLAESRSVWFIIPSSSELGTCLLISSINTTPGLVGLPASCGFHTVRGLSNVSMIGDES